MNGPKPAWITSRRILSSRMHSIMSKLQAREVVETAFKIRTLLAAAKDEAALRKSVQPDFSRWIWKYRPRSKQVAMEFFMRGM